MYLIVFLSLLQTARKSDVCSASVTMDQGSICLFLAMRGLSASEVHNELVAELALEVIASSAVTRHLSQRQFPAISPEPSDEPPTTIIDDGILEAINKQSFSSVRKLAKLSCIQRGRCVDV
jgi:hypothetical protein